MGLSYISNIPLSNISYNLHISKTSRKKYQFDSTLFSITGNLLITNLRQARSLANKINELRRSEGKSELQITAGLINAVGLMHEIFHFLIRWYEEKENPGVISRIHHFLKDQLSDEELNKILIEFIDEFPPLEVYNGKLSAIDYINATTDGRSNIEIIIEEIILLQLENINPAGRLIVELFSDDNLTRKTKYKEMIESTELILSQEKPFGPENLSLIKFLKKPILNNPFNLEEQLDYILKNWGIYIYDKFFRRILSSKDLIHEDIKLFIQHGGGEKATPPVPRFDQLKEYYEYLKSKLLAGQELTPDESAFYHSEYEKFTLDVEWMPKVVMIAKNTYVWLDQLSKKYKKHIHRLDQIPDEELDQLARWNFTALWFIGIWERSSASKKIKHLTGNTDAIASAYSLYDYVIASELGGEEAFENLKHRAWQRGIRIASDMVPNHTGIYSKWVIEKPDYFIQSSYPPYAGYTFNGPNLSDDDRVEVRIEDKYYSRQDAAVVFQRRDNYTGDVRYIYHGNDGTHMPWNDTAQLNLLLPEVREALIQTIMHVAKKFPIIRFDAAMTLAKKHYQRLWFPAPGTGGAIPSRSDYAMTHQEFNDAMPQEFWRELVDRINNEMPNTLLLAEAFWLMEGYFVRTLGMHRVYNSAFMHMMMKEENDKYHELIKNTLDFNPEILKRYVNFMSNPDEETAVNQFGKGDKYFGVAMMMVTLPGLPMFGHGQIEGYSEKYGMEYKRAYYDESIDEYLVRRHEHEIFPITRKRYLFAEVINFEFFEMYDDFGNIISSVFAFTNQFGDEKALVIYNNSFQECSGTINFSVPKLKTGFDDTKSIIKTNLADALKLKYDSKTFYICRNHKTNLEHLFSGKYIHDHGFFIHLWGYEYKLFWEFREVYDSTGIYQELYHWLQGRGVQSINDTAKQQRLIPVHTAVTKIFSDKIFKEAVGYCFGEVTSNESEVLPKDLFMKTEDLINEIIKLEYADLNKNDILVKITNDLKQINNFNNFWRQVILVKKSNPEFEKIKNALPIYNLSEEISRKILFLIIVFKNLNVLNNQKPEHENIFDNLWFGKKLYEYFDSQQISDDHKIRNAELVRCLSIRSELLNLELKLGNKKQIKVKGAASKRKASAAQNEINQSQSESILINKLFESYIVRNYLNYNEYDGIFYYSKERFEYLLDWLLTFCCISFANALINTESASKGKTLKIAVKKHKNFAKEVGKKFRDGIQKYYNFFNNLKAVSEKVGYRVDDLIKYFQDASQFQSQLNKNSE